MFHKQERDTTTILELAHGKANALDLELLEALTEELTRLEAGGARSLVLTGKGTIFSAGVDLIRLVDEGSAYVDRFLSALEKTLAKLFLFPRPVVAAVNGHAVAGGCILALACDYRLAAAGKGRIGIPEQRVGVPFPSWPLEIVRFAVSPSQAQAMMHLGRTYLMDEALTRGLLDEVVEPGDLVERAVAVATDLATIPPETFRLTKQMLRRPVSEHVERDRGLNEVVLKVWRSEETRGVIREYLAKTLGKGK
jgi:enoyl-CoA hydratase